jgi:hypothetical protein
MVFRRQLRFTATPPSSLHCNTLAYLAPSQVLPTLVCPLPREPLGLAPSGAVHNTLASLGIRGT